MKKTSALFLLILNSFILTATHNRAGEITYVQISDLTYEITITTFTYTLSFADRQQLDVNWGDNTISTAPRVNGHGEILPNYYKKNIYKITHTYPGPGVYKIVVQDPNRNFGVRNIPSSVNVVFAISTILIVNPAMGKNSTPVLLNPPYDKAALGYVFIHNPAAYDPDGDSLSFKMSVCLRDDGKPIENFTLPPATRFIRVDSVSGDLIWDTPADTGKYNVAMNIEEWRNGKKISIVERDMQIEVFQTNNKPPVNQVPADMCVEAGQSIDFLVTSTDANKDRITLKATSGVFSLSACRATFTKVDSIAGYASKRFRWNPCMAAVRNQPYNIVFKSDDNNSELMLSDIDNMNIKVLGPPPVLVNAIPQGKFIRLTWESYGTSVVAGYNIYRKEGASGFKPDSCTSGLPASTGFVKVGYISGYSSTSFTDEGQDLQTGREYTYRIVAIFSNGAESKASNEITSALVAGVPVIRNVSVVRTDISKGSVFLCWKKPDKLDTIPAPGPYEYTIYRAQDISGNNFIKIASLPTADLSDTTYTDTLFNTRSYGYLYRLELWNRTPGNEFQVGEPGVASSMFLKVTPGDMKARFVITRNVPWLNKRYDFFRLNETTMKFDSIGSTGQLTFTDNGLVNGKEYCYYVRSTGDYQAEKMPKNLVNLSQVTCVTPVDNEAPCPPELTVRTECDSLYNNLKWEVTDPACLSDISGYNIFYKPSLDGNFATVSTINDRYVFSFRHYPGETTSGCYAVSAFDSKGNESGKSVAVCVADSCNFYEIPNVFTPNGDNFNDRLIAKTSGLVEKVDLKLFNRDGLLIFSTTEPRLDWDGTYKGKIVSPGVYFYSCEVFEKGLDGPQKSHRSGFVHVITTEGAKVNKIETK